MTIYQVFGVKGGVGTTTTACMLALELADHAPTLLIDQVIRGDVATVLGTPDLGDAVFHPVGTNLVVGHHLHYVDPEFHPLDTTAFANVVIDCEQWDAQIDGARRVMVMANDYLSARRSIQRVADDVVLRYHPDHALDVKSIESAVKYPIHLVAWDPRIARTIDAGLLAVRRPVQHIFARLITASV